MRALAIGFAFLGTATSFSYLGVIVGAALWQGTAPSIWGLTVCVLPMFVGIWMLSRAPEA